MGVKADFVTKVLSLGASALQELQKQVPQLEDEVTVQVWGEPGHNKQQLYFLALAAANGVVRRFDVLTNPLAPSYGMLMAEYDAADNWVRCTIRYKWSCLSAVVQIASVPRTPDLSFYDKLVVYRGPQCNVIGGNFDFVSPVLPGLPDSSVVAGGAPSLPFNRQPILTPCPIVNEPKPTPIVQNPVPDYPIGIVGNPIRSPNPKPIGDERSRGAVVTPKTLSLPTPVPGKCCDINLLLVPLVFSALSAPATNSDMRFVAPPAVVPRE